MKNFTAKQKEIVARKLGYEGPMQGFDEYIQSSPALAMKYSMIGDKLADRMAKGGAVRKKVKKFSDGGDTTVSTTGTSGPTVPTPRVTTTTTESGSATPISVTTGKYTDQQVTDAIRASLQQGVNAQDTLNKAAQLGATQDQLSRAAEALKQSGYTNLSVPTIVDTTPGTMPTTQYGPTGVPQMGEAVQAPIATTQVTDAMKLDASKYVVTTPAPQASLTTAAPAAAITAPTAVTPQSVTAATATPGVEEALAGVTPATGTAPEIEAAQLTEEQKQAGLAEAQQIEEAQKAQLAKRELQAGELVSGSTVDMTEAEKAIAMTKAEEGKITEDMTVQGQLTKLTANFDANNPPPWAAGALRAVTAELSARGLGASSMAGQAMIQAAFESAIPIASADAAAYRQMEMQNLSNRQQVAVLAAQQRAAFLGQKFDQEFQTKVLNAAKIADIANVNFSAQQQVYLENARLAQSVDIANLNARQATTIANAATLANMEMANLNARQQTAVINAQNFLQMEMQNMSNRQQASLFKAQTLAQAALSDAAAENAARQFNASSKQQADQFNNNLATQVAQFNAAQANAMAQFNAGQANSLSQFNAQMQSRREEFNATNRMVIDQANAQLLVQVSTANTAATNAANMQNAQMMNNMTMAQYNNEVQLYRDQVKMVYDSHERSEDRAAAMATAMLSAQLQREAIDSQTSASWGKLFVGLAGTAVGGKALESGWDWLSKLDFGF